MDFLLLILWTFIIYKVGYSSGFRNAYKNVKLHIDKTGILFIDDETWTCKKQK